MKTTISWFLAITAVLLIALPVLWMTSGRWGSGGMMGGYGMMGRNYGFMGPIGWLGMAFMWLIPAAILFLLAVGAAALINNLTQPSNPDLQGRSHSYNHTCQNCGKPAQPD